MRLPLLPLLLLAARPAFAVQVTPFELAASAPAQTQAAWESHYRLGPATGRLRALGFIRVAFTDDRHGWRSCDRKGDLDFCVTVDIAEHERYAFLRLAVHTLDGSRIHYAYISPETKGDSSTGRNQRGDLTTGSVTSFRPDDLFDYLNGFKESGLFSPELFFKEHAAAAAWAREAETRYAAARAAYPAAVSAVKGQAPQSYDGLTAIWNFEGDRTLRVFIGQNGQHRVEIELTLPPSQAYRFQSAYYADTGSFARDAAGLAALLSDIRAGKPIQMRSYFPNSDRR